MNDAPQRRFHRRRARTNDAHGSTQEHQQQPDPMTKRTSHPARRRALFLGTLQSLCLGGLAAAAPLLSLGAPQDGGPDPGQDGEPETVGPPAPEPPVLPGPLGGDPTQDLQQEMIQLFHSVERKLIAVDDHLAQAGAGVIPLEAPEDAGLDDLLRAAVQASNELSGDIDRMLQVAQEMQSMQASQQPGQQGQQGQPQSGQSGQSPLDERNQGGQQGREQTPEGPQESGQDGPQEQPGGEQPGDDPQEREGEGPDGDQPDGERPDGDQDNPDSGSNRDGEDPGGQQGARSSASGDADRWGELPVRVREVFRNQGREDLPVQYRDWIDAYYRRLNAGDR